MCKKCIMPHKAHISLRYPKYREEEKKESTNTNDYDINSKEWNIDGMERNVLPPFNLLVGVALNPQTAPFEGQLIVWPSTHKEIHQILSKNEGNYGAFLHAVETVDKMGKKGKESWKEINAEFINMDVGDILVVHPFLAHCISENYGSNIIRNVYFRVAHRDLDDIHEKRALENQLWLGFQAMKDVLADEEILKI